MLYVQGGAEPTVTVENMLPLLNVRLTVQLVVSGAAESFLYTISMEADIDPALGQL